jgi:hypothetical protein
MKKIPRRIALNINITANRALAVYLVLSHPLSKLKQYADALSPSKDVPTAAKAVVDMLNTNLKLNLATTSPDYLALVDLLNNQDLYNTGVDAAGKTTYLIDTTPTTLLSIDSYQQADGCPSVGEAITIFNALP